MTRFMKTTVATLTLGLATLTPTFAKAEDHGRHEDRREVRDVRPERRDVRVDRREVRVERDVRVHDDVHVRRDWPVVVHDRVYVEPAPVVVERVYDEPMAVADLPGCVLDTVRFESRGVIDAVTLVRTDGPEYYRVTVDAPRGHLEVRVGVDGRLLGVREC